MSIRSVSARPSARPYTHRALFYEGRAELVDALVPFVEEGLDLGERVVVAVDAAAGNALRRRVGPTAKFDLFDASTMYAFPIHTLAAYVETVREGTSDGRAMRVAGEPIWAGRSPTEVEEWTCVEAACNVVFVDAPLTMLCPYDVSRLSPDVVEAAGRTHPEIQRKSQLTRSASYSAVAHQKHVRSTPLPPAPQGAHTLEFVGADRDRVLAFGEAVAREVGMARARLPRLRETIDELVTISAAFDGTATIRMWVTEIDLICELEFIGSFRSPFAGLLPAGHAAGVDALWSAGQRCNLIAVREPGDTAVVRAQFADYLLHSRPACEGVDELLGVYALNACQPEERTRVETHLRSCHDCREELERMGQVVTGLDHSAGNPTVTPEDGQRPPV